MGLPRCLVLNSTNEFLNVLKWNRAVRVMEDTFIPQHLLNDPEFLEKPKYLQDCKRKPKAEVLAWFDDYIHSEKKEIQLPAVMRLNYCVKTKKQERLNALTLRLVLVRDNWTCQYCGGPLSLNTGTKDHVVPVCRNGPNSFTNVVAACRKCNNLKDNMSLERFERETGMILNRDQLRKPTEEEKIRAVIKGFKSKERKIWMRCLKEKNIELW